MAKTHAVAAVLATILLATVCCASAQMPAAAPGSAAAPGPAADECLNNLLNLTDCLSYVTSGSKLTAPEKPCCGELAGLLESHPVCLCELLGKASSFGISIDVNRALKLPSVCNVATPPLSTCAAAGVPVSVPAGAPGGVPETAPGAPAPAAGASSPTPGNTGNRASENALLLAAGVGAAILQAFL